jgi:nicotinic acid mononucleotide adenylyltransferase
MNKPFKTSVTFGRFNLPHFGHLDLFRKMAEVSRLVQIGLSEGPDNLPVHQRLRVLGTMLNEEGINFSIRTARQPFDFFEKVSAESNPDQVIAFFGEDQFKLASAAARVKGWEATTIKRLTASTQLRYLIDHEEWDLLAKEVPPSIFNEVIKLRHLELARHTL